MCVALAFSSVVLSTYASYGKISVIRVAQVLYELNQYLPVHQLVAMETGNELHLKLTNHMTTRLGGELKYPYVT